MAKKKHHWHGIPRDHPYADDMGTWIYPRLLQLKGDPNAMILVANAYIEFLAQCVSESCCKNGSKLKNHRDYPYSSKLLILNELGMIDDDEYKLLDAMRDIRNKIAHEPFFEFTSEQFDRLKINGLDDLEYFLRDRIFSFTHRHLDVLHPFVLPNMTPPTKFAYKKRYAAVSHEWVDVVFPLIQERGWTCEHCGVNGKNYRVSRPIRDSFKNHSFIVCGECKANVSMPKTLIQAKCGEEPTIERETNTNIVVHFEPLDLRRPHERDEADEEGD